MENKFNENEVIRNLKKLDSSQKENLERERKKILEYVSTVLKAHFEGHSVQVFIVGSLIQPEKFRTDSDIDVVLKNFKGDRFEVWSELESKIKRKVEVILYEKCPFRDHVDKFGLRIH